MDPRTILNSGIAEGLHPGGQLYLSVEGKTVIDFVCGEARTGIRMRPGSITAWYSSGKPLTAILLAQLYESGKLDLESPVAKIIPEFERQGKGNITFRQVLTHTAGLRVADDLVHDLPWSEAIKRICDSPPEAGWQEKAGYSKQAGWIVLGEAIQRLSGRPFAECIKAELLDPLGMFDSWLQLPASKFEEYGERMAFVHDTSDGKKEILPGQDASEMQICSPGSSARGPARELARFYEMLLNGGILDERRFLKAETVRLFTKRQRVGLYDRTFMHTVDYGLGFIVNSIRYGERTVPYGYGRHASAETFGHSGAQSSCAFADPRHGLVAAWVVNGLPGERAHQARQRAINEAIYAHLGLGAA